MEVAMSDLINRSLFALINAPAVPDPLALLLARGLANWLLYLMMAGMIAGWLWGRPGLRKPFFLAGLSVLAGLGISQIIAAFWYHPRPFEVGLGHQFLAHGPETSFPSDHATVMFAVSFSLLASAGTRWPGVAALAGACAVAWARVYLGVHWPLDMLGSAVVAALASVLVLRVATGPVGSAYRFAVGIYDRTLERLHLPGRIFPRSGAGHRGVDP